MTAKILSCGKVFTNWCYAGSYTNPLPISVQYYIFQKLRFVFSPRGLDPLKYKGRSTKSRLPKVLANLCTVFGYGTVLLFA